MRVLSTACVLVALLASAAPAADLRQEVKHGPVLRALRTAEPEYKRAAELILGTDFIVIGQVVNQQPHLSSDASQVLTEYTIEVSRVLVGDAKAMAPGALIGARVRGGHLLVDGVAVEFEALDCPPIPWLVPHVFYLEHDAEGGYRIRGGSQGVWELLPSGRVRSHHPDVKHTKVPLHFNQRPLEFMLEEVNETLRKGKR
ncbi:MAG TPA: hypothetical protein VNN18_12775 [Candidatus Xenobia bacterium]|nr:hypothetical protein [Candidatus Xenobia bacterium]